MQVSVQFVLWWMTFCYKTNNWVLKGIMSVTAILWRIYLIAIDGLVVVALYWAFLILVGLFFPFWTFWICKACFKDLPFIELIYRCWVFLFYFLLCKIVLWVLFLSFGMLFFCLHCLKVRTLNLDSRNKVRCFLLCQVLRNDRNDKMIWL